MTNEFEQVLKETEKLEGNAARPKGKSVTFFLRNDKMTRKILNTEI